MDQTLFRQDLKLHLSGEVLEDNFSLGLYATDASVYQINPIVVVLPKDEADVVQALKIARDHKVPVLPRGGGTSLAGQTVGQAMILDFSKFMNQVLEFNPEEKWVRVQPGLIRDELNAFLKPYQLHFAPDPATSSRANIGGMIGNNSSGTKSILYGKTVDHVMELKVLLADGTLLKTSALSKEAYDQKCQQNNREGQIYREFRQIIANNEPEILQRFPKVMRRVQGYNLDEFVQTGEWNLSKLICGSEGTLGVIVEAKIRLEPLPRHKSVCVVHFAEVLEAIQAVNPMLPFQPAAIEILDETVIRLSRENLTTRRSCHFIEGHPAAIQIVEFYGNTPKEVLDRPQQMAAHLQSQGLGYAYPVFPEGKAYEDVWTIRKKGLGLMLGIKGNKKPLAFIEDAGIPTEHLPEYIDQVLQICKKNQTEAAMYAHASVGVIHVRPILDLRQAIDIERFKNIAKETFQLVKKYGGSWSGEHGDGLVRSFFLPEYFGPQVYEALKEVKALFDPEYRMNPGKIIDSPPIDQSLRYGTTYKDKEVSSFFQFREDGGFANAIHMCTGVGECRKLSGGTMCPSFKATRDEEHSTRGRANALRLAMSGQLGPQGFNDQRLHDALDLCLSCKACKSECPSNVDMAKLKSEVWQKRYDVFGLSSKDKLVRDSANWARRLSGWPSILVNAAQSSISFRYGLEKIAGIDRRRILPSYARQSFANWYRKHYTSPPEVKASVVLFADTFLNYHEPNIGIAATYWLKRQGYEVVLAEVGCCQRPRLSGGFLRLAQKEGTRTAIRLDQFLQTGQQIVVCEPSCASALQDDLPDLLEDKTLGKRLKESILPLEVFVHQEMEAGRMVPSTDHKDQKVLLHGHCHQKALYGTQAIHDILTRFGMEVVEIPSGCCGMAGSFGYEKSHYDLSRKIGEEILFKAINEMDTDTLLIANGVSCRQQIQHFTNKKANYWIEVFTQSGKS